MPLTNSYDMIQKSKRDLGSHKNPRFPDQYWKSSSRVGCNRYPSQEEHRAHTLPDMDTSECHPPLSPLVIAILKFYCNSEICLSNEIRGMAINSPNFAPPSICPLLPPQLLPSSKRGGGAGGNAGVAVRMDGRVIAREYYPISGLLGRIALA